MLRRVSRYWREYNRLVLRHPSYWHHGVVVGIISNLKDMWWKVLINSCTPQHIFVGWSRRLTRCTCEGWGRRDLMDLYLYISYLSWTFHEGKQLWYRTKLAKVLRDLWQPQGAPGGMKGARSNMLRGIVRYRKTGHRQAMLRVMQSLDEDELRWCRYPTPARQWPYQICCHPSNRLYISLQSEIPQLSKRDKQVPLVFTGGGVVLGS